VVSCFCRWIFLFSDWFWLLVKLLLLFLSYLQAWLLTPLVLLGYLVGAELFYSIIIMGDTKDLQDSLFFGSMTSTKLKGSNYLQWSRAVLVFLTGRGKESYLTTTKPTDATKISKWIKEDAQIMTWLWNSLEPDVFNNVSYLESSKDIWDTLHLMYSSEENITRIHELYQDMFSLQQGDRSIEEYFSLLQGMWDELNV
jgi:hypothetical protein